MQNAVAEGEGAMAAIIGLDDQDVIQACAMVDKGIVSAVNFNSPGQVVIAGNTHSVDRAMDNAKELGAKRALPLPVSVPSHCDLMKGAADSLYQELLNIPLNVPDIPVIHNQNADQARDVDEIRQLLKLQLYQPVLWVQCVQQLVTKGATDLIEMGPGKVLSGLTRRINKSLGSHPVYDLASLEKTQQNLEDE
ncbi:MAG: ACP S-malonyltransferase, partial [Gammaproteobacteria bacterium]|nr:ACP S-malonyltransferase [Gammaproteobacteria bacterium]